MVEDADAPNYLPHFLHSVQEVAGITDDTVSASHLYEHIETRPNRLIFFSIGAVHTVTFYIIDVKSCAYATFSTPLCSLIASSDKNIIVLREQHKLCLSLSINHFSMYIHANPHTI